MTSGENIENSNFQALWRKLGRNQRRFVVLMPEYSSKKDCALAMGLQPTTVYNWPDYVDEAVELFQENVADAATGILVDGITKAALVKTAGLDSGDERIQQMSATEILDRYFGKPKQRTEHTGKDSKPIDIVLTWND